jgi:hypothetical protein
MTLTERTPCEHLRFVRFHSAGVDRGSGVLRFQLHSTTKFTARLLDHGPTRHSATKTQIALETRCSRRPIQSRKVPRLRCWVEIEESEYRSQHSVRLRKATIRPLTPYLTQAGAPDAGAEHRVSR